DSGGSSGDGSGSEGYSSDESWSSLEWDAPYARRRRVGRRNRTRSLRRTTTARAATAGRRGGSGDHAMGSVLHRRTRNGSRTRGGDLVGTGSGTSADRFDVDYTPIAHE